MDRAEAFTKLGQVTQEIKEIQGKLDLLLKFEQELYDTLGLVNVSEDVENKRKRLTKSQVTDIRLKIRDAMKELHGHGMTWLPMHLIISRMKQSSPTMDEVEKKEIEGQIRAMSTVEGSSLTHNGMRGHGSCYTYIDGKK